MARCWPAWLALLAFALYLWPAVRVLQLGPDQVEYIDIARRLVAGGGYLLGIKAFHFGGTDVLHDGLAERPPPFTLAIAGLLALGLPLVSVQIMNAVLTATSVGFVGALAGLAFGTRAGVLAGVLAMASPILLERMITPMSEALAVTTSLAAMWLLLRFREPPSRTAFFFAGTLFGFGYLARPATALIAATMAAGMVVMARDGRRVAVALAPLALGVTMLVLPISLHGIATRGSLSYSGQDYLYAIRMDSDVMHRGLSQPVPNPAEFVTTNLDFVVPAVGRRLLGYLERLLLGRDWLLPLLPTILLAVALVRRGRDCAAVVLPVLWRPRTWASTPSPGLRSATAT